MSSETSIQSLPPTTPQPLGWCRVEGGKGKHQQVGGGGGGWREEGGKRRVERERVADRGGWHQDVLILKSIKHFETNVITQRKF